MRDIDLPVPKKFLPDPEPRNMDDYARLVLANLHAMEDLRDSFKSRQQEFVNVPFSLDPSRPHHRLTPRGGRSKKRA